MFDVRGMGLCMELHSFWRCSIGSSVEEAEHQQQPQKFEEGPVLEEIHQGRSQGCQRRLMAPVGGQRQHVLLLEFWGHRGLHDMKWCFFLPVLFGLDFLKTRQNYIQ